MSERHIDLGDGRGAIVREDGSFEFVAQYEPTPEKYGTQLYYDSTYHTYLVEDHRTASEEGGPTIIELGPIGSAMRTLQHRFGMSRGQAREAVTRAFSNFNDGINLEWVRRVASKDETQNLASPAFERVIASATDLGHEGDDEDILRSAASMGQIGERIATLVASRLTDLRALVADLDDAEKAEVSRQVSGLEALLEGVYDVLEDGLGDG
jgi:hypothetical protein